MILIKTKSVIVCSICEKFHIRYMKRDDLVQLDMPGKNFPMIEIATDAQHNAWVHIVKTDCSIADRWIYFIDSVQEDHLYYSQLYPFYTFNNLFYDHPWLHYSFMNRPVTSWIGHAYEVNMNRMDKTVECIGGVCWGYKLKRWHLSPKVVMPGALDRTNWIEDWKLLSTSLSEYEMF